MRMTLCAKELVARERPMRSPELKHSWMGKEPLEHGKVGGDGRSSVVTSSTSFEPLHVM